MMLANIKAARRSVNCPGHGTGESPPMQSNRNRDGGHTGSTTSGRQPGHRTVARQLRAALAKLEVESPSTAAVRQAHELTGKALANLDGLVERLAAQDADGHRRHAIRQAKNLSCCPAGPTMNSVPVLVLEFWTRQERPWEWPRVPELERVIDCDWTEAEPWAA